MTSGVHTVPANDYHADTIGDRPSLSAGIIHVLCSSSPAHAWAAHPRLNPNWKPRDDDKFDLGRAVHAWFLEGENGVQCVPFDDWRTNAAKEEREAARAAGRIPLLAKHWEEVQLMCASAAAQFEASNADPPLFSAGKPEQTIVWDEDGVLCKARLDWLHDDLSCIDDLKTAHNANPEKWRRSAVFDNGYDVQCSWYLRGLERVTGERARWRWAVVEKTAPYAVSVFRPGADVLEVAATKIEFALNKWRECLRAGVWPAYSSEVVEVELPAWSDDSKWLVPEYRDAA